MSRIVVPKLVRLKYDRCTARQRARIKAEFGTDFMPFIRNINEKTATPAGIVTRTRKRQYLRRIRRLREDGASNRERLYNENAPVGRLFAPWDLPARVSALKGQGIATSPCEEFKDVLLKAFTLGVTLNVVSYTYHTYCEGEVSEHDAKMLVPEEFTIDPSKYPYILKHLRPFYDESNHLMAYIGRLPGKYSGNKVIFPRMLPQSRAALFHCIREGYLPPEAEELTKFISVGSGEHCCLDKILDTSARPGRWRQKWRQTRQVFERAYPDRDFTSKVLTFKDVWDSRYEVWIKRNTGVGVRDKLCHATKKEDLRLPASQHAEHALRSMASGCEVLSSAIYRQGRRPKRQKLTDWSSPARMSGRSICIPETWEIIVITCLLQPLKKELDNAEGTIFSSYSRASRGWERMYRDFQNSTHRMSGDHSAGEFHFHEEATIIDLAFIMGNYTGHIARMGFRFLLSHLGFIKLVFAGGHTLGCLHILPSGVGMMSLLWGFVNRHMYNSIAFKILRDVCKRYPQVSFLHSYFVCGCLGDDGKIDFTFKNHSDRVIYNLPHIVIQGDRVTNWFWRDFGFTTKEFQWSDLFSSDPEDHADFLKEVMLNGTSNWKGSELLKTVTYTPQCYFPLLRSARKRDTNSRAPPVHNYSAFKQWQGIASAGVNLYRGTNWFVPYGAKLWEEESQGVSSYAEGLKSCKLLVDKGVECTLNYKGLHGYSYYLNSIVKQRSYTERFNFGTALDELDQLYSGYARVSPKFAYKYDSKMKRLNRLYSHAHGLVGGRYTFFKNIERIRSYSKATASSIKENATYIEKLCVQSFVDEVCLNRRLHYGYQ